MEEPEGYCTSCVRNQVPMPGLWTKINVASTNATTMTTSTMTMGAGDLLEALPEAVLLHHQLSRAHCLFLPSSKRSIPAPCPGLRSTTTVSPRVITKLLRPRGRCRYFLACSQLSSGALTGGPQHPLESGLTSD